MYELTVDFENRSVAETRSEKARPRDGVRFVTARLRFEFRCCGMRVTTVIITDNAWAD